MQAFKCSVCQKYYDGCDGLTDQIRIGIFSYTDRLLRSDAKKYDLCPDCRDAFFEFVKKRRFESIEGEAEHKPEFI